MSILIQDAYEIMKYNMRVYAFLDRLYNDITNNILRYIIFYLIGM